jgi:hypothetical protein
MTTSTISKWHQRSLGFTILSVLNRQACGAKNCFLNFNRSHFSLSVRQAEQFYFTGVEQPEAGDLIFFDISSTHPKGYIAIVKAVCNHSKVIIQTVKQNSIAWSDETCMVDHEIYLQQTPPLPDLGAVMGWLRLRL